MQRAGFTPALYLLLVVGCAPRPAAPPAVAPTGRAVAGVPAVDTWAPPVLPPPAPIQPREYAARRDRLASRMGDGVFLALGAPEPAEDYLTFNQNSNFRYLTGIVEPGAALVVVRRGTSVASRLFVRPRDPAREIWDGARLGVAGAMARTGLPTSPIADLLPALDSLLHDGGMLYTASPAAVSDEPFATFTDEQQVARALAARHGGVRVVSLDSEIQRLRAKKSAAEIDRIRRAVYVTSLAHRAAMHTMEPGLNEFEIQAVIEYAFRRNGSERPSFASIVGSGPNSTALHYNADDRFIRNGEVVVMDIGASYDGYAADVTRTVPAGGRFSPDQRAVYEIVLAAQKAAESRARPGATWQQLDSAADSVIARGLTRLGLIDAPDATYRCALRAGTGLCRQMQLFYMHGLGHGLGLDVHDPETSYSGVFQVGSIFTIEPGIYIRDDVLDRLTGIPENEALSGRIRPAVERLRNTGVRIEDDFLITPDGADRLSAGAPREIDEIEALMRLPGLSTPERRPEVVEWYHGLGQN